MRTHAVASLVLGLAACEGATHETPVVEPVVEAAVEPVPAAAPPVVAPPKDATLTPAAAPPVVKAEAAPPWVAVPIDGEASWVEFRDEARVWVAIEEVGTRLGIVEHDVASGARRAELVAANEETEVGSPAALSHAAGLWAFTEHSRVIMRPLAGGADRTIAVDRPDALAFSPAGDRLAMTFSEPGIAARVEVYSVADGKRVLRAFPFGKGRLEYDSGPHVEVVFVGDSERLALLLANDTPPSATLADGRVSGKKWSRRALNETEDGWGMAASLGQGLAASADGAWLAVGNFETRALLFPTAPASEPVALTGGEAVITALVFDPDGRWVAAAGEDGPLRIHAVPTGELLARAEAPKQCTSLAVSPSGRKLAGGCDDELRIWDVEAVMAVKP